MTRQLLLSLTALLAAIFFAGPAWGEALRLETPLAIITGDVTEPELRAYGAEIAALDGLMTAVTGVTRAPSAPVTIHIFRSLDQVRKISGAANFQGGVWFSTPFGARIIVAPEPGDNHADIRTKIFHEYAHWFRVTRIGGARPLWYEEGFASFFESATPTADGQIKYGRNAQRSKELRHFGVTPSGSLLTLDPPTHAGPAGFPFYLTGWLITRHMLVRGKRGEELNTFIAAYARGAATGDLNRFFAGGTTGLDADLLADASAPGPTDAAAPLGPADPAGASASIRPLTAKEQALVALDARSLWVNIAGAAPEQSVRAKQFFDELAQIATRFPDDLAMTHATARLGLRLKAGDRLIAMLTAALTQRPADATLLALRGAAHTEAARNADVDRYGMEMAAGKLVIDRALRLEPENPDALRAKAHYLKVGEGASPEVAALMEGALRRDPSDTDLKVDLANTYELIGKTDLAVQLFLEIRSGSVGAGERRYAEAAIARLRAN